MADILIKGMEMPKSCPECSLADSVVHCPLTGKTYNWGLIERPSDCPLVEVPPHGRLIDADALRENIKESRKRNPEFETVYTDDYFIVANWLRSAPTIIEREGGT